MARVKTTGRLVSNKSGACANPDFKAVATAKKAATMKKKEKKNQEEQPEEQPYVNPVSTERTTTRRIATRKPVFQPMRVFHTMMGAEKKEIGPTQERLLGRLVGPDGFTSTFPEQRVPQKSQGRPQKKARDDQGQYAATQSASDEAESKAAAPQEPAPLLTCIQGIRLFRDFASFPWLDL
jgi:hypothetical protein